jgi:hypothetical protein
MKLNNRIALTLALSAALFSASALAQDAGTAAAPAPTAAAPAADAPAAAPAKPAKKAKARRMANHAGYESCLKQKLAVAEYFCGIHSDSCQSEKDGAAAQCRSEARGERQKG